MSQQSKTYNKDRLKLGIYNRISGIDKKLKTGMQSIIMQLQVKKLIPENIQAIELFGMHGLWHTKDYIGLVKHLDIFEIDPKYQAYSKKALKNYPVDFFQEDSIAFVKATDKKYNWIVSDSPYSGPFYGKDGLPLFFDDMIRCASEKAVIIMNIHSEYLADFIALQTKIHERIDNRKVKDLFFYTRNEQITYAVIVLN